MRDDFIYAFLSFLASLYNLSVDNVRLVNFLSHMEENCSFFLLICVRPLYIRILALTFVVIVFLHFGIMTHEFQSWYFSFIISVFRSYRMA